MAIELVSVSSSMIAAVGYDAPTQVLDVQFNNGDTYSYDMVPENVYQGFFTAPSAGQYFRNYVKGRYRFFKA